MSAKLRLLRRISSVVDSRPALRTVRSVVHRRRPRVTKSFSPSLAV
jgi:hypothetical protein